MIKDISINFISQDKCEYKIVTILLTVIKWVLNDTAKAQYNYKGLSSLTHLQKNVGRCVHYNSNAPRENVRTI